MPHLLLYSPAHLSPPSCWVTNMIWFFMGIQQLLSINPSCHQNNKLCYGCYESVHHLSTGCPISSPEKGLGKGPSRMHSQCPAWHLEVEDPDREQNSSAHQSITTLFRQPSSFLDLKFETRRMVRQTQPQTWKPSVNCFLETFETTNSPLACSVWRNLWLRALPSAGSDSHPWPSGSFCQKRLSLSWLAGNQKYPQVLPIPQFLQRNLISNKSTYTSMWPSTFSPSESFMFVQVESFEPCH
jgi:hypothetical protein